MVFVLFVVALRKKNRRLRKPSRMECYLHRTVTTYCLGGDQTWERACPRLDTTPLREASSPVQEDDLERVTCSLPDVPATHVVHATLNEDCTQWVCTEYAKKA